MFIPRCSSQVRRLRMMVPYVFIAILHTAILVAACESHEGSSKQSLAIPYLLVSRSMYSM